MRVLPGSFLLVKGTKNQKHLFYRSRKTFLCQGIQFPEHGYYNGGFLGPCLYSQNSPYLFVDESFSNFLQHLLLLSPNLSLRILARIAPCACFSQASTAMNWKEIAFSAMIKFAPCEAASVECTTHCAPWVSDECLFLAHLCCCMLVVNSIRPPCQRTCPTRQLFEDLLWIGEFGEMGFVLPQLQFFVGCPDGVKILARLIRLA